MKAFTGNYIAVLAPVMCTKFKQKRKRKITNP